MIVLRSVSVAYGSGRERVYPLDNVSAAFEPGERYVIFGMRGVGKTTLLRIISGIQQATGGSVQRGGLVSPPIGSPAVLTGDFPLELIRLYAALYRIDYPGFKRFIEEFMEEYAGLEPSSLGMPFAELMPEARRALAYALSYGVPADFYLFDGMVAPVGNIALESWCKAAFEQRRANAATLYATRTTRDASKYGERGAILHNGKLELYDDLDAAIRDYEAIEVETMNGSLSAVEFLVSRNQLPEAYDYLRSYVADNPNDIKAHRMLADIAGRTGDADTSIAALKFVVDRDPLDVNACYALARAAEQKGDLETAVSYAERLLRTRPSYKAARVMAAKSLDRLGRASEAASQWRLIASESNVIFDYVSAYRCDVKARDWPTALTTINSALRLQSDDATLLAFKLQALLELGQDDEFKNTILRLAIVDVQRALIVLSVSWQRLEWRTVAAILMGLKDLDVLKEEHSATIARITSAFVMTAREMVSDETRADADEIRNVIGRLAASGAGIVTSPGAAGSSLSAAEILVSRNQLPEAYDYLRSFIADNPDDVTAHRMLADVAGRTGDTAASIAALKFVIDRDPLDFNSCYAVARDAEQKGDLETAVRYAERLLRIRPNHKQARIMAAKCLDRLGRPSEAASEWRLVASESNLIFDYVSAYRCDVKARDWHTALATINSALRLQSDDAALLAFKLQALLEIGENDEFKNTILQLAIVDMQRALIVLSGSWRRLEWHAVAAILMGLKELGVLKDEHSALIARITKALESMARKMMADETRTDVDEIRQVIGRLSA
jgi:capsular polysaccharide transport system ATP-binding protein